jgi:hypothetical protein
MMHFATTINDCALRVDLDRDRAILESKRVAKWYQVVRLFRRHDARDNCCGENRTFPGLNFIAFESSDDFDWQFHNRARVCRTISRDLLADIDHCWPVMLINMTQLTHLLGSEFMMVVLREC